MARLHIEWQTIAWVLVSAIVVYEVDGPNRISQVLALIGVLGAFFKAGIEHWQRWQLSRSIKEHSTEAP